MEEIAASPAATAAELQRLQAIINNMPPLGKNTREAAKVAGKETRETTKVKGEELRETTKVEGDVTRKNAKVLGREARQTARVLGREGRETGDVVARQDRLDLRHDNRNRRKALPGIKRAYRRDRQEARVEGGNAIKMARIEGKIKSAIAHIEAKTNRKVHRFDDTTGKRLSRREKRKQVEQKIAEARKLASSPPPQSSTTPTPTFKTTPETFMAKPPIAPVQKPKESVSESLKKMTEQIMQWFDGANVSDLEYASLVILKDNNAERLRASPQSRKDVINEMNVFLLKGGVNPEQLKQMHTRLESSPERAEKHAKVLKEIDRNLQLMEGNLSWDEIKAIAEIMDPSAETRGVFEGEAAEKRITHWVMTDLTSDPQFYTEKQAIELKKHVDSLLKEKIAVEKKADKEAKKPNEDEKPNTTEAKADQEPTADELLASSSG